jgi:hypothetical protein
MPADHGLWSPHYHQLLKLLSDGTWDALIPLNTQPPEFSQEPQQLCPLRGYGDVSPSWRAHVSIKQEGERVGPQYHVSCHSHLHPRTLKLREKK